MSAALAMLAYRKPKAFSDVFSEATYVLNEFSKECMRDEIRHCFQMIDVRRAFIGDDYQ